MEQSIGIEEEAYSNEGPGGDHIGEAGNADGKEESVGDVEEGGDHHAAIDVHLAPSHSPG